MKKFLFFGLVALLLVACNKNQKVVKTLDGDWDATAYTYLSDGVLEDVFALGFRVSLDFDNCKLKEDEFCKVTWTNSNVSGGTPSSEVMEYRVAGYGSDLELKDITSSDFVTVFKIVELTKEILTIELKEGGDVISITLEK